MMRTIVILILCGLFLGCGYQSKLKKAKRRVERTVKRFPELERIDTARVGDTTYLSRLTTDSIFSINFDTITIENNRATVRLIRINDTIYTMLTAKADTIIKIIKVPYRVIEIIELNWWQKNNWWLIPVMVLLVILTILKIYRDKMRG